MCHSRARGGVAGETVTGSRLGDWAWDETRDGPQ